METHALALFLASFAGTFGGIVAGVYTFIWLDDRAARKRATEFTGGNF